jgi:hypothetical protein
MARIMLALAVGIFLSLATHAQAADGGGEIVPGLITANNVDVTTDTGELLDQRLNIGDRIFIITKPKKKKDGWVRISKTPEDSTGIGWVESKYTRSFRRWEAPSADEPPSEGEKTGEKTVFVPDVEAVKYSSIGILPFVSAEADDPIAKWAYDAFTTALQKDGRFRVSVDSLRKQKFDPESVASLQQIASTENLDGVFVGNLSGVSGGSRLLQVKFYGKGREGFVIEKVKKLPKEGNLKEVIDGLVSSCVTALASK